MNGNAEEFQVKYKTECKGSAKNIQHKTKQNTKEMLGFFKNCEAKMRREGFLAKCKAKYKGNAKGFKGKYKAKKRGNAKGF